MILRTGFALVRSLHGFCESRICARGNACPDARKRPSIRRFAPWIRRATSAANQTAGRQAAPPENSWDSNASAIPLRYREHGLRRLGGCTLGQQAPTLPSRIEIDRTSLPPSRRSVRNDRTPTRVTEYVLCGVGPGTLCVGILHRCFPHPRFGCRWHSQQQAAIGSRSGCAGLRR